MMPSERATNAQLLLENEVFDEAFGFLEKNLIEAWKASPPDQWKARESTYSQLKALHDVKNQLENFIHTAALETTANRKTWT